MSGMSTPHSALPKATSIVLKAIHRIRCQITLLFLAEATRNPVRVARTKVKSPETRRKSQNLIRRSQLIRPIKVLVSSSRWRPWLKLRQKPVYYGPMKASATVKSAILSTNETNLLPKKHQMPRNLVKARSMAFRFSLKTDQLGIDSVYPGTAPI